jgi:hypothetical protein
MPFFTLRELELEQPVFGANYIKGKVIAEPNGLMNDCGLFILLENVFDFSNIHETPYHETNPFSTVLRFCSCPTRNRFELGQYGS